MLPGRRRVTSADEFRVIIRTGGRASSRTLVAHVAPLGTGPTRAGFIVGRSVGGSVVRSRVTRRLRHQVAPLLDTLPESTGVVVRALAPAAGASSQQLGADLATALSRALNKVGRGPVTASAVSP